MAGARDRQFGTLTWPDWLAGKMNDRERLHKIMAAVHRCYMEHKDGETAASGPHMTISMAENYIEQMLRDNTED